MNKLKTEYLIIGSKQKLANIQIEQSLKIGDMEIKGVKTIKSLGLIFDESLTWDAQVEHITTKVNSGLNILRKWRKIVDHNTLIMVFKSIVQQQQGNLSAHALGRTQGSHLYKDKQRWREIF